MTDSSSSSASEIQVNVKGPSELKLQITITTDKTVLELKQAIAEKSDVPADRQRLIYSGRVLKDDDLLSVYKIQSLHTIHMVKGAAKPSSDTASSSSPSGAAAHQLPRMQTGQNVNDPLTQLNGHMGFGAMAGLNPFADMGLNANDPNMLQNMMGSPEFLQQMSSMMSNPAILDQVIAMNPQLASMGPQVREALSSPQFREMISNPESMRMMMNMANVFQGSGGAGGMPNPFGANPAFPAPGVPTGGATPATGANATATPTNLDPGATPGTGAVPPNPFFNPALMQQMQQFQQMQGMFGGGMGGMGGFGAPTTPAAPADTRSPEERFQVQLQQLQDMGFSNASQNVRALLATAGNVHSAIEYILGGGGI